MTIPDYILTKEEEELYTHSLTEYDVMMNNL
jgi:hypothetical protein